MNVFYSVLSLTTHRAASHTGLCFSDCICPPTFLLLKKNLFVTNLMAVKGEIKNAIRNKCKHVIIMKILPRILVGSVHDPCQQGRYKYAFPLQSTPSTTI